MRNAREINKKHTRGGIPATLVVFLPIDVFEGLEFVVRVKCCVWNDLSRDQAVFELLSPFSLFHY